MPHEHTLDLVQITNPHDITTGLRRELIDCWIAVTNTGGAAGFPFPPVGDHDVVPVVDKVVGQLNPQQSRLLMAKVGGVLAGWVILNRDPYRLIGHWGTIHHLQTHPDWRGRGIGVALVHELRKIAREELGLEQLHLAARGGEGLEDFYGLLRTTRMARDRSLARRLPARSRRHPRRDPHAPRPTLITQHSIFDITITPLCPGPAAH